MYPEKKGGSHKMARPQQNWGLLTLLTRWASIWTTGYAKYCFTQIWASLWKGRLHPRESHHFRPPTTEDCPRGANIGSDNGLSPVRRQTVIWTTAAILSIRPWGTHLREILIKIQNISFKEMHSKMWSAKWRPFCLSLNVFNNKKKKKKIFS